MNNTFTVGGIEFTAIRTLYPRPHWRLQLPSGEIWAAGTGGVNGESRPKLRQSVEDMYERTCRHHGRSHWSYSLGLDK